MTVIGDGCIAYSVAIQNNGKIIVVGESWSNSSNVNEDFTIVRYDSNGSLDSTFNSDGIVTTDIGSKMDKAYSVAIQDDGKIVVAGYSNNGSDYDFAIVRYNSNGSLDTLFSDDGKVTTDLGNSDDYARSVIIQNDGKIVVAGYTKSGTSYADSGMVRYNSNGTLDSSFGDSGKVITDIVENYNYTNGIAIQNDGKIVAVGESGDGSDYAFAIMRYQGGSFVPLVPIYYLLQ